MNGTVTRRERKSGAVSWGYSFFAGRDEAGKRLQVTRSGFGTKREAQQALRDAIAEHQSGKGITRPSPKTLAAWLDEWLREHAGRKCAGKTVERYKQLAAYATARIGTQPLSELTSLHLERLYNELRDRGGKDGAQLSAKTVRHIAGVLHGALEKAVKLKMLRENPASGAELPQLEYREAAIVEPMQLEWWIDAARAHWPMAEFISLASGTGARRGELLGLQWSDYNPVLKLIRISKSLEQTAEGLRIKSTKTGRPRAVRLPESAVKTLEAIRAQQEKHQEQFGPDYRRDLDLIFCTPEGDYLKPDSVTAKACLLAQKVGLKGISLHSLRHTHGSHLLSLGVPLPTVSKRLGHSNTRVTAEIYAHALDEDELNAIQRLDSVSGKTTVGDHDNRSKH